MNLEEDSAKEMTGNLGNFADDFNKKMSVYKEAQHKLWKFELQGRNGCRSELKKARSSGDRDIILEGYFQNDSLLYEEWMRLKDNLLKAEIEYEGAKVVYEVQIEVMRFIPNV